MWAFVSHLLGSKKIIEFFDFMTDQFMIDFFSD